MVNKDDRMATKQKLAKKLKPQKWATEIASASTKSEKRDDDY